MIEIWFKVRDDIDKDIFYDDYRMWVSSLVCSWGIGWLLRSEVSRFIYDVLYNNAIYVKKIMFKWKFLQNRFPKYLKEFCKIKQF